MFIATYSNKGSYLFTKKKLIRTDDLGRKKVTLKQSVKSIYIQKTHHVESGTRSTAEYMAKMITFQVMFKMKRENKESFLLSVENRDSLHFMVGIVDEKGKNIAREESIKIAQTIAMFWEIPFRV